MPGQELLSHAGWIIVSPLIAFLVILAFRRWIGLDGAWVGVVVMGYGLIHSLIIACGIFTGSVVLPYEGLQGHFFAKSLTWFSIGFFDFRMGLLIDGLSAIMLVVVALVSFLVQIYSLAYMDGHKRYGRYFAYVNLFTFSMFLLVLANNLVQFFIGWELVGLCSYLLIGFDYEREAAAYAGRKAFLVTKVGDLGLYIGLLIVFNFFGTFDIPALSQNIQSVPYASWVLTSVPLLLFMGAIGKSAQVPLHVWLPDAMEGPTPASALIHAATMVAAGVYMVARLFFLFEAAPISLEVVAWVGTITAVLAATMGLVASDIKRVLAFSTVSQLGFMMAALGCGGYQAGMFHLTTHAAFKALLFLCAGSVIHAVHTNDMWKMGGLLTKMPFTATTYFIAMLAIAGFPFTAGFFSKEAVLASAFEHNTAIFVLLAFAALLTTFYMFRSWFLTFTGLPRDKSKYQHAHESPPLMTVPLVVLAVPSLFLGGFFAYHGNISKWIHWGASHTEHHGGSLILAVSIIAFLLGLGLSLWVYYFKPTRYDQLAKQFSSLYKVLLARYKFDELYLWFIAKVYHPFSQWLAKIDFAFVDQKLVDGVGGIGKFFSWVSGLFDDKVVDQGAVDGSGTVLDRLGAKIRSLQSGFAQGYLLWMTIGLVSMLVWVSQYHQ